MSSTMEFGPRRGIHVNIADELAAGAGPLSADRIAQLERFDLIYRSLCALLYNYVPMSGHPGGSISSGRFVASLLFGSMDYDIEDPERPEADLISYAAGHKALGLYAMWALRDEVVKQTAPELLPDDIRRRLRLEDLLGFRRNPVTDTPFFKQFDAKPLDGHPTPATPFVRLSTGPSGVGVAASVGLAFGARDYYGKNAPRVHVVEGEGGMTPGRVAEAMAAAGTAGLDNCILHVDWNQASIDSDAVCRDGSAPGDYVQWDPRELAWLHDFNLIEVPDGFDLRQVHAAQARALAMDTGQPTAIVYRTVKGWHYGMEGRASHGAGHKFCSDEFVDAMMPLFEDSGLDLPGCDADADETTIEACYWESLQAFRALLEREPEMRQALVGALNAGRERLDAGGRAPREGAPNVDALHAAATGAPVEPPADLALEPGGKSTLRAELGKTMNWYNRKSDGAMLAAAADLLGSTSVDKSGAGFGEGFWHADGNAGARILSMGGICEDAIGGICTGISAFGRHLGVASSYAAFMAPLGHIAVRVHAIGNQAKAEMVPGTPYKPVVLVCAHAGMKTGEDGPTHADPQALQLLQGNFAPSTAITLTPWDPRELWHLFSAALVARPAVIAPFVTRPNEPILDREALGLAPVADARQGVYLLRAAKGGGDGTVVLQGSGVTNAFVAEALPRLIDDGLDLNVYYVASAELFDALGDEERERIFPAERAAEAMGITGFTLPTLYRWVTGGRGRAASLHPFAGGHYLGSGQADKVMAQAGLDGESQYRAVRAYVTERVAR